MNTEKRMNKRNIRETLYICLSIYFNKETQHSSKQIPLPSHRSNGGLNKSVASKPDTYSTENVKFKFNRDSIDTLVRFMAL